MVKYISEMSFEVNSARIPQTFNMNESNANINRRSRGMKWLRDKTNLEIRLICCLILSLVISGTLIIILLIKYRSCLANKCSKTDKIVLSGQTPVFIEDSVDYIDLNYQPYYKDPKMKSVIIKSRDSVEIVRNTLNIPCICVGISINGSNLWAEGVGYSDIENGVKCHKHTSMRLASISKPITSILVGLLIESGKLELDVNINEYLSIEQFPKKRYNNKEFNITLRQLMSHTAGIRESKYEDFTTIHNFTNITQTLSLFANDDLIAEPGTKFHYSNPSWNLVGAIIESVLNETFDIAINSMLNQALGMLSSSAEKQEIIVPYKAKYYQKNNLTHELENSDFIDDISASIEKWWPSGGILSTVGDLLHFGNSVIKSYEQSYDSVLKTSTMNELLKPHSPQPIHENSYYGLGWMISNTNQTNSKQKKIFWHSGEISGVSTLLVIIPDNDLVLTLLSNLGGVVHDLQKLGALITNDFIEAIHRSF